jgi:hypothetical protein
MTGLLRFLDGPIEGTVNGDRFSFRHTKGSGLSRELKGDLLVNGDEMVGFGTGWETRASFSLRRHQ